MSERGRDTDSMTRGLRALQRQARAQQRSGSAGRAPGYSDQPGVRITIEQPSARTGADIGATFGPEDDDEDDRNE